MKRKGECGTSERRADGVQSDSLSAVKFAV